MNIQLIFYLVFTALFILAILVALYNQKLITTSNNR